MESPVIDLGIITDGECKRRVWVLINGSIGGLIVHYAAF